MLGTVILMPFCTTSLKPVLSDTLHVLLPHTSCIAPTHFMHCSHILQAHHKALAEKRDLALQLSRVCFMSTDMHTCLFVMRPTVILEQEMNKLRLTLCTMNMPLYTHSWPVSWLVCSWLCSTVSLLRGQLCAYRLDVSLQLCHSMHACCLCFSASLLQMSGARDDSTQKWEPIHKRRSMPKVTNHKP